MYGDVILLLTTKGDTSASGGLAVFTASPLRTRTATCPTAAPSSCRSRAPEPSSRTCTSSSTDSTPTTTASTTSRHWASPTLAKSLGVNGLPEEATNPATCGTVTSASTGEMPSGGVDTGDGTTDGIEAAGTFGLAGAAFAAAGGVLLYRRRLATDKV